MSSSQLNQMKQIIKWMFEPEWQIINVNFLGNRKSMARLVSDFFPGKWEDPSTVLSTSHATSTDFSHFVLNTHQRSNIEMAGRYSSRKRVTQAKNSEQRIWCELDCKILFEILAHFSC